MVDGMDEEGWPVGVRWQTVAEAEKKKGHSPQ